MTDAADLTLDDMKPLLIAAMLPHVPFDGWSQASLALAAADTGIDPAVARLALPGAIDMIDAYIALADERMETACATPAFAGLKIRERIAGAIRTRLEQAAPHREAIRRASAILALPPNALRSLRLTWRTADAIWRTAGDRSTDFSYYSRRVLAGGVYASTLLVWLDDDTEGFADTWGFLDRRIADVMRIETLKSRLRPKGDRFSVTSFLGRLRYRPESD